MLKHFKLRSPTLLATLQAVFIQVFPALLLAIQAPLLGPRPFGLITLAMILIGFCEFVQARVATDTLISIANIEELHFSTMTTVLILISLVLGAIMFLAAHAISGLFGDAEFAPVLRSMAVIPLVSALWVAPSAATMRHLQFRPTVMRAIASLTVGGVAGVILALLGAGVWALVVQALLNRSIGAIALWLGVPLRLRLTFSRRHFDELYRIAIPILIARWMDWAAAHVPRLILGLYLGTTDLGLYGLGIRFTDIIKSLAIEPKSVVARIDLRRCAENRQGLEAAVCQLFLQVSAFSFPLCLGCAAIVPALFRTWLDERWLGGIICAQLLLLSCVPYVTFYCATAVLLALNQRMAEALISTSQTVAVLLVVLITVPFGLNAASAGIVAAVFAMLPLPLVLMNARCGVSVGAVLGAQLPALAAALVMAGGVWLIDYKLETSMRPVMLLPLLVIVGAGIYTALMGILLPDFTRDSIRRLRWIFGQGRGPEESRRATW